MGQTRQVGVGDGGRVCVFVPMRHGDGNQRGGSERPAPRPGEGATGTAASLQLSCHRHAGPEGRDAAGQSAPSARGAATSCFGDIAGEGSAALRELQPA